MQEGEWVLGKSASAPALPDPLPGTGYGECLRRWPLKQVPDRGWWKAGFHYQARGHGAATPLYEMEGSDQGPEITYWNDCGQGRSGTFGLRKHASTKAAGWAQGPGCLAQSGGGLWVESWLPGTPGQELGALQQMVKAEEAGAIGEANIISCRGSAHMSLPWPAIFHGFLSEFNLHSDHNQHFPETPGSPARCLSPICSHHSVLLPGLCESTQWLCGLGS